MGNTLVRRSLLAVSPLDGGAVLRAASSGADAVVLDLARGPAAHRRSEARGKLGPATTALIGCASEILIWTDAAGVTDDLSVCNPGEVSGVLVTVETADEVSHVDQTLTQWEGRNRVPSGQVHLEIVLASVSAVHNCTDLASASRRTIALALDEQTLLSWSGEWTAAGRDITEYCRGHVVVAARALSLQAHGSIADGTDATTMAYAFMGKRMGFHGALCIDADAVPLLNSGFGPSQAEVDAARRILSAMDAAIAEGRGAIATSAGTMADLANVRQARTVIDRANTIAQRQSMRLNDNAAATPGPNPEEGSAPPWR